MVWAAWRTMQWTNLELKTHGSLDGFLLNLEIWRASWRSYRSLRLWLSVKRCLEICHRATFLIQKVMPLIPLPWLERQRSGSSKLDGSWRLMHHDVAENFMALSFDPSSCHSHMSPTVFIHISIFCLFVVGIIKYPKPHGFRAISVLGNLVDQQRMEQSIQTYNSQALLGLPSNFGPLPTQSSCT